MNAFLQPKLLFADNSPSLGERACAYLSSQGYQVLLAQTGGEALRICQDSRLCAAILSDMLLDPGGCAVCRSIKERSNLPVIMLTDSADDREQFACYRSGADFCMKKPLSYHLLGVRLQVLLKRSDAVGTLDIQLGGLSISPRRHEVLLDGRPLSLAPREFSLLHFFATHRNIVMSRDQILSAVWGASYHGDPRTVDTHVKCLRAKLGVYGSRLITLRKVGYKLEWKEEACSNF